MRALGSRECLFVFAVRMLKGFPQPNKSNPAFKGKWYAPLIDNPLYKGIWKCAASIFLAPGI
jgi:hypothetical protein